jgi:putative endopeptidase
MKKTISLIILTIFKTMAQPAGINFSYIDSSASPKQDFYSFCNGKWQKSFQLPASDARYGSFNEINDNNLKNIKLILDAVSKNKAATPNTDLQRLRDFYNTAMDSVKADKLGYAPIEDQLRKIESVNTINEFMILKSEFDFMGINLLFSAGVSPDLKNSRRNSFGVGQDGFGLGDRDYYYEAQFENIRAEYKKYLANLFTLIGTDDKIINDMADQVFGLEVSLTNKALTREQMRDIEKMYNIYSPKALNELSPTINWADYFKHKKMKQPDTVIISMVDYAKQLDVILKTTPIGILKAYAKAHLLMQSAPFLSSKFVSVHFNFRGVVLSGAKQMKPRWQRVQNTMNGCIGEIVSKEYVKKHFTPDAKMKVNKLIDNLVLAYRDRIASRDWMSAETKKQANKKLDLLIRKVGYPDKWKNYSGLAIVPDNYWANVCRANKFLTQENLNELKKPVDRNKWQMTPVTVNAYYATTVF